MEKIMVFDDKTKSRMAFICFLPVVCFLLCFLYYLALIIPLASGHPAPGSIVGITSRNYDTLLLMLATAATITAPVFIYCLIIIARLKTMNAPTKLKWIIFLSVLAPVASAFFWLFIIRGAQKYTPIYHDIA